ncbi:MAG: YcxB family protein [Clostridia bacterium]|nr:YcxB family protein [Clostridia bacterium]
MITFDRQQLIKSQNDKFNRVYMDINFFVWLGWGLTTVMVAVIMYFFSINVGLWLEAFVLFGCSIYYLLMSFVKERVALGYYQKVKEIQMDITSDGIVLKEIFKEDEIDYLISFNEIYKVVEYKNYFVIMLKNEGRIVLPNSDDITDLKTTFKNRIKSRYHVYER